MKSHHIVVPLAITLWAATGSAQVSSWESENAAGMHAYQQRSYAEAENLFKDAVQRAAKFGESDPRFSAAINNLAAVLQAEGKYSEAEQFYQRAINTQRTQKMNSENIKKVTNLPIEQRIAALNEGWSEALMRVIPPPGGKIPCFGRCARLPRVAGRHESAGVGRGRLRFHS